MSFIDSLIEQSPALIIAIPLLFAFATPLIDKFLGKMVRNVWVFVGILLSAILTFIMAWEIFSTGDPIEYVFGGTGNLGADFPIIGEHPVRITFYVDGMGAFMGLIMATVAFAALIYSYSFIKKYTGGEKFYTLMLLMLAANFGMVFTGDLFNLFVWFEVSSIAVCGLTAFRANRGESFEGAAKYLIFSTIAGLLFLFAIGLLYGEYGHLNINLLSEAIAGSAHTGGLLVADKIALGIMVTVFALKAGSVPMHMATPDAYSEAPAPITAMFVTASQAGLYALFRSAFTLYGSNAYEVIDGTFIVRIPEMIDLAHVVGWIIVILGILSMFVGVTLALVQKDIKRLMAYHAISQTGYMLLGVGVGLAVLANGDFIDYGRNAMAGGIFHIFNHALYKGLLFLTAGAIIYKAGTRDLNKMGGLGRDMKLTAVFFIIGALAIAGVPPMNGFSSKLLIYESVFQFNPVIGAIAMLVSLLTLASFVKVFYSAFMGPKNKEMKGGEVPRSMLLGMAILAGMIIVFSVAPSVVVRSMVDPAVEALTGVAGDSTESLTLFTSNGSWNTIVFLGAVLVTTIIALILYSRGQKGTVPKGEGKKPYLWGNPTEIDGRPIVIPGSNVYWGFVEAMGKYYKPMERLHSGLINEYVFWLICTIGIVIATVSFWGVVF
jgi:multicomponent Na+:H+ antiporter subunit D